MIDREGIEQRRKSDGSKRDERGRRVFAASEARAAGYGGLAAVSEITGLTCSTIGRGLQDLDAPPLHGRVRREGGGGQLLTERDPTLLANLERLVEPVTRGDPERPLLWVSKSLAKLAAALGEMGHAISPNSVRKLLGGLGFPLVEGVGDRIAKLGVGHNLGCDVIEPRFECIQDRHAMFLAELAQVFVRTRAPYRKLDKLYSMVRRRLRDAGVQPPGKCGPHIFRHARAVEMLRAAVPQKIIGDVLGHRSTGSTAPYLKLATEDLRAIALDVPGMELVA